MSTNVDMSGDTLYVNSIVSGSATAGILGGQIVPGYEYIQSPTLTAAASASQTLWVNPNVGGTYQIAGATVTQGTASSSGTFQVEVATGTQAIGSGTNQLSAAMSTAGTANTPVNGALATTLTTIAAGNRVNIITGGTQTSLANCIVTIALQRIS